MESDLNFRQYKISSNRYRELKYFCRQYREKKAKLCAMTQTVEDNATRRAELEKDVTLIEQAAAEAGKDLAGYIIRNVTDGTAFEYLGAPCGRSTFFRIRQRFYYILDKRK